MVVRVRKGIQQFDPRSLRIIPTVQALKLVVTSGDGDTVRFEEFDETILEWRAFAKENDPAGTWQGGKRRQEMVRKKSLANNLPMESALHDARQKVDNFSHAAAHAATDAAHAATDAVNEAAHAATDAVNKAVNASQRSKVVTVVAARYFGRKSETETSSRSTTESLPAKQGTPSGHSSV